MDTFYNVRLLGYMVVLVAVSGIMMLAQVPLPTKTTAERNGFDMELRSSAFTNQQSIPVQYTCDGQNVSPPLEINDAPAQAKSLALIVDDPDAPAGNWVHWTVWNIDPQTKMISENSIPPGALEGLTDFGTSGFGGPCPPSGTHRYQFKLYALDTLLSLQPSAKKREMEKAMAGHILDQVTLVGTYSRK